MSDQAAPTTNFSQPDRTRAGWLSRLRRPRPWWRRLRITREGKYHLGITVGVGLAAINTGNNLLYLLLGTLLSLIVVSGILSELSLRHLRVRRRLPRRAQVGRPHVVEIEVFNQKKHAPSYAIEVEDLRAGQPSDKRCFFLKISPHSMQVAAYRRTPARRGLDQHTGFRIATRFPFGFFEKSRDIELPGELVIYPAVDPITIGPPLTGNVSGSASALVRGQSDEIIGIRPMRDGDDPRDIYWRRSTHPEQMVLRERTRETRRDVDLLLDVSPPEAGSDSEFLERFERHVREVASRAVAHLRRGDTVRLSTTVGDRVVATSHSGADTALKFLALVQPADARSTGGAQRQTASIAPPSTRPALGELAPESIGVRT